MGKLTIWLCILVCYSTHAFAEVYKCTIAGKLVFTDQPCAGETVSFEAINAMPTVKSEFTPLKPTYRNNQWYYGHSGYKQALALQKKYDAPIFLYFQADWCGYCRQLETNLLKTKSGILAMRTAIKVQITPEESKQDNALFLSLGGKGFPSLFMQAYNSSSPTRISTNSKVKGQKTLTANELKRLLASQ